MIFCVKFNRQSRAVILAKLYIDSGLLALLVSIIVYALEHRILDAIQKGAIVNQDTYRHRTIEEHDYHAHLKQSTLQIFLVHYTWKAGLAYGGCIIPTNIILLFGLIKCKPKLICCWLIITMIFLILSTLAVCGIFVFATVLYLMFAVFFLIISLLLIILGFYFWYIVYKAYKNIRNEQYIEILPSVLPMSEITNKLDWFHENLW